MCRRVPRVIGFPRGRPFAGSRLGCGYPRRPSPDARAVGFILPRDSCLFRAPSLTSRPFLSFGRGSTCLWVSSLIATSPKSVRLLRGFHAPLVPPSGFLNLSTVCSTTRLRGLVSSRSHVQGSSVHGFVPAPQPHRLVAGPCLLALVVAALTGCPAATRRRLRFEALLHGAMRSSWAVV